MGKNKSIRALCCAGLLLSQIASAEMFVGANLSFNSATFDSNFSDTARNLGGKLDKTKAGVGFYWGNWFNETWGMEVGFDYVSPYKVNSLSYSGVSGHVEVKSRTLYAEGIGRLPISDDERFVVLGALGFGYYDCDSELYLDSITSGSSTYRILTMHESGLSTRIGGGVQYNISDSLGARAMLRYMLNPSDAVIESNLSFNLGLSYQFEL